MILSRAIVKAKRALDPTKSTMSGEVLIDAEALTEILNAVRPPFPLCNKPRRLIQGKATEKFCPLGIPNFMGMIFCSKSSSRDPCPGFYKCKASYRPRNLWTMTVYSY